MGNNLKIGSSVLTSARYFSCCSTPLVVLGLVQKVNGVGVTQSMNVLFHAPAPM